MSIFLSNFRIRSGVEDELAQMVVLKAIGYTSNMIIVGAVMPYVFVGIIATVIGILPNFHKSKTLFISPSASEKKSILNIDAYSIKWIPCEGNRAYTVCGSVPERI